MAWHLHRLCMHLPFCRYLPFYYLEQWNTFYWDADAVCQTLVKPGGVAIVLADFLMQFFCYGAGPVVYGILMTLVAYAQSLWVKEGARYLGCITAVAMLMTLVSNMSCLLAGSVCLVMIMFLVAVVLRCRLWLKVVAVAMIALVVRRNCLVREGSALNFMVYLPWLMAVVVGVLQLCYVYLQKQLGKYGLMAQCLVVLGAVVVLFVSSYQAQDEYMKKILISH